MSGRVGEMIKEAFSFNNSQMVQSKTVFFTNFSPLSVRLTHY